jgi:NAD(P)-dependent dehydrogenase (short-subunit alcohol dehydrogenase family)
LIATAGEIFVAAATRNQGEALTPTYPDMQGKVALVTGGSSGIGLAVADAFARRGTRVVIASRREATAKSARKQLSKAGDVQWHPVDTADGKSVARLIEAVTDMHGRLDYAFNNGGSGGRFAPVASMTEQAQDDRRLSDVGLPVHGR